MNKLISMLLFLFAFEAFAQTGKPLVLIGQIPGRYFDVNQSHQYFLGYVEIQNKVIQKMGRLTREKIDQFVAKNSSKQVIKLKRSNAENYDVIYPGLINLHNHTKQNNLPIWDKAAGQFANRFEWRDWPVYKYSVSGNMNPWVDYNRAIECATFRWSELQAMIQGTTYLQGPSSCVENFGVLRVEDADSYISKKAGVQAPTDLVMPIEMQFVWNTLGPIINTKKTYEQALAQVIKQYCPTISVTPENVNSLEMLKIFKDQAMLTSLCQKEGLPDKFIRYVYWIHPTIAGRKNYFSNPTVKYSAVIAHLAEGRRDDPYNQKEFEIVRKLGLDVEQMNFVHGVGIPSSDFPYLAQKNIGLIWSPFSNLILYSQTLDITKAFKANVRLAIGSDWLPTGTKSVLEEVKLARRYIVKDFDKEGLVSALSSGTGDMTKVDEELFKMITENPAKMIGHSEIKKTTDIVKNPSGYEEAAVGRLAEGAMGSVIVVPQIDKNPYSNLIQHTYEKDILLVVVNGNPVYGNVSYLDLLGYSNKYERLPVDSDDFNVLKDVEIRNPPEKTPENMIKYVISLIADFGKPEFRTTDKCKFPEQKAFVFSDSVEKDEDLKNFRTLTGINLDRVSDITKLLAISLLTQNRNKIDATEGKKEFAMQYFPSLYSCNDETHQKRLSQFIKINETDEFELNRKFRNEKIEEYKLGKAPGVLNSKYNTLEAQ